MPGSWNLDDPAYYKRRRKLTAGENGRQREGATLCTLVLHTQDRIDAAGPSSVDWST